MATQSAKYRLRSALKKRAPKVTATARKRKTFAPEAKNTKEGKHIRKPDLLRYSIDIGRERKRWQDLKNHLGLDYRMRNRKKDEALASFLLDMYFGSSGMFYAAQPAQQTHTVEAVIPDGLDAQEKEAVPPPVIPKSDYSKYNNCTVLLSRTEQPFATAPYPPQESNILNSFDSESDSGSDDSVSSGSDDSVYVPVVNPPPVSDCDMIADVHTEPSPSDLSTTNLPQPSSSSDQSSTPSADLLPSSPCPDVPQKSSSAELPPSPSAALSVSFLTTQRDDEPPDIDRAEESSGKCDVDGGPPADVGVKMEPAEEVQMNGIHIKEEPVSDDTQDTTETTPKKDESSTSSDPNMQTCFVYISRLLALASAITMGPCKMAQCREPVKMCHCFTGSAIHIEWVCLNEHVNSRWCSQPEAGDNMTAGDLKLAECVTSSGVEFETVQRIFRNLNMPFIDWTTYEDYKNNRANGVS